MDELPETPTVVDVTSPLRDLMAEFHEVYRELRTVGFNEKQALSIVAHMVGDAVSSRGTEDFDIEFVDDEDDEDDEDDDYDDEGTSF